MEITGHVTISGLLGWAVTGPIADQPALEFDLPLPDSLQGLADQPELAIRLLAARLGVKLD